MVLSSPRQQLTAYSPLSGSAMARALLGSSRGARAAVDTLSSVLRQRYAAETAVLVDSGTSALQLALRIAVAASGSERALVALPAFTCFEVATAAVGADVGIMLYDVLPDSLAPDPESLERALQAGARTVVVSPLFGVPVAWDAIEAQLAPYDAIGIEDAAQGHGASWRERPLGTFGQLSVISFGRGKGWTGSGGGALLVRGALANCRHTREAVAAYAAPAGDSATSAFTAMAQWALGRPSLYGLPAAIPALALGSTVYHPPQAPRAIDRFTATLLLETLGAATREAARRRDLARQWRERLAGTSAIRQIGVPAGGEAGYIRFPIRVVSGNGTLAARTDARRLGIATSYPAPLDALPPICARRVGKATPCPGAWALARQLVTLPTHSLVSTYDIEAIHSLVSGLTRNLHGEVSAERRALPPCQ